MKKNRNAFFNESNMNYQGYNPMVANAPYQNANNPYAGQMPMPINNPYSEWEERLAKIERQISRIEHRLSQLENASTKSTDDFESTTNNMYML